MPPPERKPCQETRVDGQPCPNRARFRVVCVRWAKSLCGVHGRPYRNRFWIGGRVAEGIISVTEI